MLDYAETMARGALVLMGVSMAACDTAAGATPLARRGVADADRARDAAVQPPETRKKAPITPAIIAASKKVLEKHHHAALGTEVPIVVEGRAYVARIEEHDNASGSPSRPPGKHRGVTVYQR